MFKSRIRLVDIKAIVKFTLAFPFSEFIKHKYPKMWLFSERPKEARDNGYCLFEYCRKEHPEMNAFYVILDDSLDYKKVCSFENVISFGSFKHYIYYLAAYGHASAHVDAGTPNSRVSNFLETHRLLKNKKVFLQHGITKDKISFGYYSVNRADLFICGAKPEYDFCKEEFDFPDGHVKYTGFARFDKLHEFDTKKQILIMPTWRSWLAKRPDESREVAEQRFLESDYYLKYKELLHDDTLIQLAKETDRKILFYPHSDMQVYVDLFRKDLRDTVTIAGNEGYDVQQLLKESELLITDYSSVAFDFAYMKKPVIYYQFDYAKYRQFQHPEGYYSYEKHGFGPIVKSGSEIATLVRSHLTNTNDSTVDSYLERAERFYPLNDTDNCKRIFEEIEHL